MTKQVFRDFPPKQVRAGGQYVKNLYHLTCYKCGTEEDLESVTNLPDQVIKNKFHQRGWITGTKRTSDMCPVCAGTKKPVEKMAETLAEKFAVTLDGDKVEKRVKQPLEIEVKRKHREALNGTTHTPVAAAEDMPVLETKPAGVPDPTLQLVLRELADMKAALELNMEMLHSMSKKLETIRTVEVEAPTPPPAKVWDVKTVRDYFEEMNLHPALVSYKSFPDESFFMVHMPPLDYPHAFRVAQALEDEIGNGTTVVIRQAGGVAAEVAAEKVSAPPEVALPEPSGRGAEGFEYTAKPKAKRVMRSRTEFFVQAMEIIRAAGRPVPVDEIYAGISDEAKDGIPYKKTSARLTANKNFVYVEKKGWDLAVKEKRESRILEQGERTGWGDLKR